MANPTSEQSEQFNPTAGDNKLLTMKPELRNCPIPLPLAINGTPCTFAVYRLPEEGIGIKFQLIFIEMSRAANANPNLPSLTFPELAGTSLEAPPFPADKRRFGLSGNRLRPRIFE